jgi:molybdopterin-guanine dinucleotide biosynthesis protein A
MKIAAVILAGGQGSRMGGAKPLRILGAKSLLDRAIARARPWSDALAIAVRDESQLGKAGLALVLDEPGIEGPLGGLVAALRFAGASGCEAALTIPADMPFLPDDLADRLAASIDKKGAAIASSGGHLHPVCGLWRIEVLDEVADYLQSGRRSLKGLAEAVGYAAVEWPAGPADPFFNINSIEDLAAAERRLRD